ncbi:MAG: hypothetical protein JO231_06200 [Acidobacteria bacterium]|nr:hypothetical protein [Acidobacteriota bacterium]
MTNESDNEKSERELPLIKPTRDRKIIDVDTSNDSFIYVPPAPRLQPPRPWPGPPRREEDEMTIG